MRPKQREAVLWKVVLLQLKWNKGFCWDDMGNWEWLQPSCKKGKPAFNQLRCCGKSLSCSLAAGGSQWLGGKLDSSGAVRQSVGYLCYRRLLLPQSDRIASRAEEQVWCWSNVASATPRGAIQHLRHTEVWSLTASRSCWTHSWTTPLAAPPHLRCSNVFPVTTRLVATKASTRLGLTFLRDNVTKAHF